jgi:hypothetical protein
MRTNTHSWTSILATIAALGVAGTALAQPHRDDHRDDRRDDRRDDHRNDRDHHAPLGAATPVAVAPPALGAVAVAPPADPRLAERVHQLEAQRQRERAVAVKDAKTWNDGRPQRATHHRSEIANTWGNAVANQDAQNELKLHADRMARLDRIVDIANQKGDTALAARAETDIQTEINRDAQVMQAIQARVGVR